MGAHLIDGEFQSDKYPTTPRGKVPLSVKDKAAQPLLWRYAELHRTIDAEFSDDLQEALLRAGYVPDGPPKKTPAAIMAEFVVRDGLLWSCKGCGRTWGAGEEHHAWGCGYLRALGADMDSPKDRRIREIIREELRPLMARA